MPPPTFSLTDAKSFMTVPSKLPIPPPLLAVTEAESLNVAELKKFTKMPPPRTADATPATGTELLLTDDQSFKVRELKASLKMPPPAPAAWFPVMVADPLKVRMPPVEDATP